MTWSRRGYGVVAAWSRYDRKRGAGGQVGMSAGRRRALALAGAGAVEALVAMGYSPQLAEQVWPLYLLYNVYVYIYIYILYYI